MSCLLFILLHIVLVCMHGVVSVCLCVLTFVVCVCARGPGIFLSREDNVKSSEDLACAMVEIVIPSDILGINKA